MYVVSLCCSHFILFFFFFKQKTAYEMRISDWSSDVCPSDLVDALLPRGRDHVALAQRPADEDAFQRLARSLEPQILLRGRKDDARRGLRFDLADIDIFARARPGIGALEAVDADDLQPFVLGVRIERARRRRAFADDLEPAPIGARELAHRPSRPGRDPA